MGKVIADFSAYLITAVLAAIAALFILGVWYMVIAGTMTYCLSAVLGVVILSILTAVAFSYVVSEYVRRKDVGLLPLSIAFVLLIALYITLHVLANTAYARLC